MVRPGGPEVGQLAPRAPVLPLHLHRPRRLLGEAASHDDGCEVAMLTQRTVTRYPPRPRAGAGLVLVWAWQEAGPEWQPRQSVLTSPQPLRRCRLYTGVTGGDCTCLRRMQRFARASDESYLKEGYERIKDIFWFDYQV